MGKPRKGYMNFFCIFGLELHRYLKIGCLTEGMETVINHEQMLIFNLISPLCPRMPLIRTRMVAIDFSIH